MGDDNADDWKPVRLQATDEGKQLGAVYGLTGKRKAQHTENFNIFQHADVEAKSWLPRWEDAEAEVSLTMSDSELFASLCPAREPATDFSA